MVVLFDHGTPRGLARALPDDAVVTAKARGWDRLNNGALLKSAEEAAIDLLLTTDRHSLPAEPYWPQDSHRSFGRHHKVVPSSIAP